MRKQHALRPLQKIPVFAVKTGVRRLVDDTLGNEDQRLQTSLREDFEVKPFFAPQANSLDSRLEAIFIFLLHTSLRAWVEVVEKLEIAQEAGFLLRTNEAASEAVFELMNYQEEKQGFQKHYKII